MSLAQLINRDCILVQRTEDGTTDELGNEIPAETHVQTVCELQQQRRTEEEDQGEVSEADWLLVLPAGTDIDTGDSVIVDGNEYELIGAPWPARNPRTRAESHIEATVRRTAGPEDAS